MADQPAGITERLASLLAETSAEDALEVVVELRSSDQRAMTTDRPRAELAAEGRRAFARTSRSAVQDVFARGGMLVDSAWVSSTLRVVVPAGQVALLAQDENVERVDVPRGL